MKWFRLYSEFVNDPKLKTFSKSQRYDLVCLLCMANESDDRGVIHQDAEDMAATLEITEEEYAAFVAKLERKKVLFIRDDGGLVFTNWLKRQYDKPSDYPEATAARQQKRRTEAPENEPSEPAKPRGNAPQSVTGDSVTPSSRAVTRCHATYEYSDSENTQRIQDPPNPPVPKAQSGSSQAAVLEFAERFRVKHDGEGPHIPDKAAKALIALRSDLGAIKYGEALTGFFADAWASENGHSAVTFTGSSMDRWRHAAPKTRASPAPPGKSALAAGAEAEEARLRAIFERSDFEKRSTREPQHLQ